MSNLVTRILGFNVVGPRNKCVLPQWFYNFGSGVCSRVPSDVLLVHSSAPGTAPEARAWHHEVRININHQDNALTYSDAPITILI